MTAARDNILIWELGGGWLWPPAVDWDCTLKNVNCPLQSCTKESRAVPITCVPQNLCPLQRKSRTQIWNRQPWYYLQLWWVIIPKCHPPSDVICRGRANHKGGGITLYLRVKKQRGQNWKQAPPETLPSWIVWNTDLRTAPHPRKSENGQLLEGKDHIQSRVMKTRSLRACLQKK